MQFRDLLHGQYFRALSANSWNVCRRYFGQANRRWTSHSLPLFFVTGAIPLNDARLHGCVNNEVYGLKSLFFGRGLLWTRKQFNGTSDPRGCDAMMKFIAMVCRSGIGVVMRDQRDSNRQSLLKTARLPKQTLVPTADLRAQHASMRSELMGVLDTALAEGVFAGGPMVEEFERSFASYVGTEWAVGVASGTDAIRLALLAMGVAPGDTVITVPNTFIATAEAISQIGANVDFVDVEPQNCLLDPECLERKLTDDFSPGNTRGRPKVIIPVHLYGQCVDMAPIRQLACRFDLRILEDAAQAHGATFLGAKAGTFGEAAAFSFYPAKNLGALGEAGAITTSDTAIAERVRSLRNHGQHAKNVHVMQGSNCRLDAIQAGFLSVKLRHLDRWNARRREIANFYDKSLSGTEHVEPIHSLESGLAARHLYVVRVPERERVITALAKRGVEATVHYPRPIHLQESYRHLGFREGSFPNAERSSRQVLSLPIYPEMSDAQAEHVVRALEDAITDAVVLRQPGTCGSIRRNHGP